MEYTQYSYEESTLSCVVYTGQVNDNRLNHVFEYTHTSSTNQHYNLHVYMMSRIRRGEGGGDGDRASNGRETPEPHRSWWNHDHFWLLFHLLLTFSIIPFPPHCRLSLTFTCLKLWINFYSIHRFFFLVSPWFYCIYVLWYRKLSAEKINSVLM